MYISSRVFQQRGFTGTKSASIQLRTSRSKFEKVVQFIHSFASLLAIPLFFVCKGWLLSEVFSLALYLSFLLPSVRRLMVVAGRTAGCAACREPTRAIADLLLHLVLASAVSARWRTARRLTALARGSLAAVGPWGSSLVI